MTAQTEGKCQCYVSRNPTTLHYRVEGKEQCIDCFKMETRLIILDDYVIMWVCTSVFLSCSFVFVHQKEGRGEV